MDPTLFKLQSCAAKSSKQILAVKNAAMDALDITSEYLASVHQSILDAAVDRISQTDILCKIICMQAQLDSFIAHLKDKRTQNMIKNIFFFIPLVTAALFRGSVASSDSAFDPIFDEHTLTCYIPHHSSKEEYLPQDIFKYKVKDDKWYRSNKAGPLSARNDAFLQIDQIPEDVLTARDKICREFILKSLAKLRNSRQNRHHRRCARNNILHTEENYLKPSKKSQEKKKRVCKLVCNEDEYPINELKQGRGNFVSYQKPLNWKSISSELGTAESASASRCPCLKGEVIQKNSTISHKPTCPYTSRIKDESLISLVGSGDLCSQVKAQMAGKSSKVDLLSPCAQNTPKYRDYFGSKRNFPQKGLSIELPGSIRNSTTFRNSQEIGKRISNFGAKHNTAGCSSCTLKNELDPLSTPLAKKITQDFKLRNAKLQGIENDLGIFDDYDDDEYDDDSDYDDDEDDDEDSEYYDDDEE
ncbi:hypothetical protein MDAP_002777 [Mitosporidium daphniae]